VARLQKVKWTQFLVLFVYVFQIFILWYLQSSGKWIYFESHLCLVLELSNLLEHYSFNHVPHSGRVEYLNRLDGSPTREHPTYSWPWAKHCCSRSSPTVLKVCPCDLFIVIAKANRIGYCTRLRTKILTSVTMGMRGITTSSPLKCPTMIVAWMIFLPRLVICNLVPLTSFGGLMFLSKMIGQPILSTNLWGGNRLRLTLFKTSIGYRRTARSRRWSSVSRLFGLPGCWLGPQSSCLSSW